MSSSNYKNFIVTLTVFEEPEITVNGWFQLANILLAWINSTTFEEQLMWSHQLFLKDPADMQWEGPGWAPPNGLLALCFDRKTDIPAAACYTWWQQTIREKEAPGFFAMLVFSCSDPERRMKGKEGSRGEGWDRWQLRLNVKWWRRVAKLEQQGWLTCHGPRRPWSRPQKRQKDCPTGWFMTQVAGGSQNNLRIKYRH